MTFRLPRRGARVLALATLVSSALAPALGHAEGTGPVPAPPAVAPADPSVPAPSIPADAPPSGPAPAASGTVPPGAAPPAAGSTLPLELRPKDNTSADEKKEPEEKEGSRLSEIFWVNGELGASYANMRTFSVENLGITNADGGGFMAGIGAGIRIVVLSLGVRLRWHKLSPFNLIQANGELLFKIPVSKVDIIIGLHGGYSGFGSLSDLFKSNAAVTSATTSEQLTQNVSVKGWNAGLDLGFDYFINNYFSLGLGMTGDFLYLQRPKSPTPDGFSDLPPEVQAEYLNSDVARYDGKSAGFGVAGALRIGFHLGP